MSSAYRGDDALATLLTEAGVGRSPAEIRALAAGVLAAPEGEDPAAWQILVGESLPPALAEQLQALKAELAAEAGEREAGGLPRPDAAGRLTALRGALKRRGLDGFVIPRGDEHQGEYVPPRAQRLAWLTGFTGSAGNVVVTADRAALFVDGRYTLQVRTEVSAAFYEYRHLVEDPLADWVIDALPDGGTLGYDPWLHTIGWVEKTRAALDRAGIQLVACEDNPLDSVWPGQPPAPLAPVVPQDIAFTGADSAEKRAGLAEELARRDLSAAVLTQPDSIAWLLNIRGADVPCTPLPLSFAILFADGGLDLFLDPRKLAPRTAAHLGNRVRVRPVAEFGAALDAAGRDAIGRDGARVLADPSCTSAWIFDRLQRAGAVIERDGDPCALPKACKNAAELAGTRAAHRRDGAALVRFLHWFSREAPKGALTELAVVERLLAFRRENERFRGLSFDTIAGAGPNGAIVHYRATPETDRRLDRDSLFLLDSGAQYLDGTTDVTRTLAVGSPSAAMRGHFTRVLKGHIALSTARFPRGTTGSQLDALARLPLWMAGLDYDHGTGHGVGSFLSVHEGPQRISKVGNTVALQSGMILSNEPGYYRTDAYGIRIENLVVVQPVALEGAERPMLGFEPLTLVPIDRQLIDTALLSAEEIGWVDAYHARVRESLSPLLEVEVAAWLAAATAPLAERVPDAV